MIRLAYERVKDMVGRSFRGKDHCYVCGNELNWHKPEDPESGRPASNSLSDSVIQADMAAIGKDEDGTVRFEVVCTCPKCRTGNKFFISAKMI